MKVELTALEIKTEKEKIKITIEEAKALYRQLHELFGEKVIQIPSAQVIIDRGPWWPTYPPTIYFTATSPQLPPRESSVTITCHADNDVYSVHT